jgi:hypothetical protein
MSYSLTKPCGDCVKELECLDAEIIQGSINTIHSLNNYCGYNKPRLFEAHRGGGTIEIKCSNYMKKEPPCMGG